MLCVATYQSDLGAPRLCLPQVHGVQVINFILTKFNANCLIDQRQTLIEH